MSEVSVDSAIPTIESVLGFKPGERPVQHHEMLNYLGRLASASPRVQLRHYGETSNGLALVAVTISSPANLARLTEIQAGLRELDGCEDEAEARTRAGKLPVVAWLGYGIHGDEPSGSDAALIAAYELAARNDAACMRLLDRLVVHLDPMVNPDGRERYLAHIRSFDRKSGSQDIQDLQHQSQWPGGRGNHYLFDLNRDAVFGVQQESAARIREILAAAPQLFVDVHEMMIGDNYLFAVPAEPLNPHLPATVHQSWQDFGTDHAAAFDVDGMSYYTRSWNEVFYPGFFDIWPAYHGAVPILYEQAGMVATTVKLPNGHTRTYAQALANQLRSTWANLATAEQSTEKLLLRWWRARRVAAAEPHKPRVWLIPPGDAFKLQRVLALLLAQGVEVEQLTESVDVHGLHSIGSAHEVAATLPAGTLLIRTEQKLAALIRNIFDPHVPMSAAFLRKERRGLELGSKTQLFDVTAWSLPLAFGLDAFWSASIPKAARQTVTSAKTSVPRAVAPARYGYLFVDTSLYTTARLLAAGVKLRVATEAFAHAGVSYEPGTLLIRGDDQASDIAELLAREQARGDIEFIGVEGARTQAGPDLGDPGFVLLQSPSVAILTGACMDSANTGAVWHLFDAEIGVPVTLLDVMRLSAVDLSRYSVLILGEASDRTLLTAVLNAGAATQLRRWIEGGGTLLALGGGALSLAGVGLTATKLRSAVLAQFPPLLLGRDVAAVRANDFLSATGASAVLDPNAGDSAVNPVVAPGARAFLSDEVVPFEFPDHAAVLEPGDLGLGDVLRKFLPRGAYVAARLKPMHWAGFGVSPRLPVLFREDDALIAEGGADLAGCYETPTRLALSGLLWPEAVGYIANTAYLVRERHGSGQVLLFAADPVFRGYSLGTQRLFLNAALLGPAFR
ncbi:M14 family zinc carboxypeptidase [Steroidobacter sp.]|uniref:M14 family zinc carboxypeptidase n=1 Tax=Steroidobacter sp. TaxID=1978227 RepID=UPI001A3EB954|nr:M14 family zinc carboxypeptidase [Steroidobacter sp.]MBL8271478.1 hypothetical protein [Steroidobacter sp.]